MRAVAAAALLLAAVEACAAPALPAKAADVLKDWAVARCLANGFGMRSPAGRDAADSAAALLERGNYGIDTYHAVEQVVDRELARKIGGSSGGSYIVLKCVELAHSRELNATIRAARRAKPR